MDAHTCAGWEPRQAVGLAVLMAKAGLAVPAQEPACLPPFTSVLADIGDEQSLSANLSTFSAHLRQIQVGWVRVCVCVCVSWGGREGVCIV